MDSATLSQILNENNGVCIIHQNVSENFISSDHTTIKTPQEPTTMMKIIGRKLYHYLMLQYTLTILFVLYISCTTCCFK